MRNTLSKATLGRLPLYLRYLSDSKTKRVSAAEIARSLALGEIQVRKDLASISRAGMPHVGYPAEVLRKDIGDAIGIDSPASAVIVGAGRLGKALMEYDGFAEYGLTIAAAFDRESDCAAKGRVRVLSMDRLPSFCASNGIHTGILTVPARFAQEAADRMAASGIRAILNLAPCRITVPSGVTVLQENIALSLAYLNILAGLRPQEKEEQYGNKDV